MMTVTQSVGWQIDGVSAVLDTRPGVQTRWEVLFREDEADVARRGLKNQYHQLQFL